VRFKYMCKFHGINKQTPVVVAQTRIMYNIYSHKFC